MKRHDDNMKYIVTLSSDGVWGLKEYEADKSLALLQGAVDGHIERGYTKLEAHNVDMWCNEEGLLIGLPVNIKASVMNGYQQITGNVCFCGGDNATGDSFGLTKEFALDLIMCVENTFSEWMIDRRAEAEKGGAK